MAFCLWKIHSSISKPAKFILPSYSVPRNVLKNVPEATDSLRWTTYSALLFRPAQGHKDKINHNSGQLKRHCLKTAEEQSAENNLKQTCQLESTNINNNSLGKLSVNLSDLYACDPLAILLHSRLQIYDHNNSSYPSQQQDEPNKTRGYQRTSGHTESFVLQSNTATNSLPLRNGLSDHETTSPFSVASSFCRGSVASPAYREVLPATCALGSVAPSPIYHDRVLARSSLHQYSTPVPQPGNDQCRGPTPRAGGEGSEKIDPYGLPSPEKLRHVHDVLIKSLTEFFIHTINYKIYDPNIIFENKIRGTVTKGLNMYVLQITLLNTVGHLKYSHIRFDIIKITQHPEEGTIKVRWRIKGVKTRHAFTGFLKASKWSMLSVMEQNNTPNWYDGFSTFYVNSAGLVTRHVADNMMPDDEKLSTAQKTGLFGRLAVLFGILPKAGHGNAMVGGQFSDVI